MNAKQVAKMLGVHPNTVYSDIKEGKIIAEKVGRSFDVPENEVRRLLLLNNYKDEIKKTEKSAYQFIAECDAKIENELGRMFMEFIFIGRDFERLGFVKDGKFLERNSPELNNYLYDGKNNSAGFKIHKAIENIKRYEALKEELAELAKGSAIQTAFNKVEKTIDLHKPLKDDDIIDFSQYEVDFDE